MWALTFIIMSAIKLTCQHQDSYFQCGICITETTANFLMANVKMCNYPSISVTTAKATLHNEVELYATKVFTVSRQMLLWSVGSLKRSANDQIATRQLQDSYTTATRQLHLYMFIFHSRVQSSSRRHNYI